MAHHISCILLLLISLTIFSSSSSSPTSQINSNSILIALLDSHYTELTYLIEKANLLQTLENTVSKHNITIFAPNNVALERNLDPDFKHFLLQPGNILSLQTLLLSHVIPTRIQSGSTRFKSISDYHLHLETNTTTGEFMVNQENVTHPNDITRPDGVIHGIQKILIPRAVVDDFNNRRSLSSITAVKPEGAPEADTRKLKKSSPEKPGSPPEIPIYEALAPGPSLAPAPAPGPGGPHHHFNGDLQVKDFIKTLLHYGGYKEMADILVNLTSLATEMSRLVSEGYVLTVLAPNDEAMAKLTTEELSEPGSPEEIMYYHIIPEYQTEESMYNAVRRFGKVRYETLRLKYKVVAQEADGSVKFGDGDGSGYLFDPDIYTDGRISVQGIDGVLFPMKEEKEVVPVEQVKPISMMGQPRKGVVEHRRGKLLETACWMLGTFRNHSRFTSCQ
ncbi:putative FAS1 domain-containing protein [Medicago truncatula]|uniref:Fasciclin-like arabinogalactan protein 16 n=1 Tax=Medicago truncatula TaxID=3880 RepID=G7IRI1_MEDTR|nr:fasciclin-like arabinogalactan protein 15 [Medicago truncatula]AES67183.1 fasciclin-like arabinogalactan protein 16 precursor [Medicago truncatula]RHN75530.1 putative FAS1 domain-containing protein [Medicago truncatula]